MWHFFNLAFFLLLTPSHGAVVSSVADINGEERGSTTALEKKFDSWMQRYKKSYYERNNDKNIKNEEEYKKRLGIFVRNAGTVARHNDAYQVGLTSYVMTLNSPFSDLTDEEFASTYLMNSQNCSATSETSPSEAIAVATQKIKRDTLRPRFVDWRTHGVITPVKNQKNCGSCWTFSTTGTLQAHYCIAGHARHEQLDCTKWTGLAEQQLVDCSSDYDNHGCNGGLPSHAFEYIKYAGGLEEEINYPYLGNDDGPCLASSSAHNRNWLRNVNKAPETKRKVQVAEVYNITNRDEDDLTSAISEIGPVSVAFQVSSDFRFYSHGVYDSYNATSNETICKNGNQDVNHAVVAVGYGETSEDGIPYYIVRNSWSETWGMEGYFWIMRGKNLCGIADCASFPIVPVNDDEEELKIEEK